MRRVAITDMARHPRLQKVRGPILDLNLNFALQAMNHMALVAPVFIIVAGREFHHPHV